MTENRFEIPIHGMDCIIVHIGLLLILDYSSLPACNRMITIITSPLLYDVTVAPFWGRVYFSILLLPPCFWPMKLGRTHVQSEALNVFAQLGLLSCASAICLQRTCPGKLLVPGWEDTWNRPDSDPQPEVEWSHLSHRATSEKNKCCRSLRFWDCFLYSIIAVIADWCNT